MNGPMHPFDNDNKFGWQDTTPRYEEPQLSPFAAIDWSRAVKSALLWGGMIAMLAVGLLAIGSH